MYRNFMIHKLPHELLWKEFMQLAINEYGSLKMNQITNKVNNSTKVALYIQSSQFTWGYPESNDIVGLIGTSRYFVFAKAETTAIASMIVLKKWVQNIGNPKGMSEDVLLNNIFFSILDDCNGFKTHIKATANFFERFNDHITKQFILKNIKEYNVFKTDVSFDTVLCDAVKKNEKTEFRVIDNLFEINLNPNTWNLYSYDKFEGAVFSTSLLKDKILVKQPYKIGSIVNVFNINNPTKIDSKIRISTCTIQRLQDVNSRSVRNEGYSAYVDRIEELFVKDPSLDAEYCLFIEDWINQNGGSLYRNEWLWVISFYLENDNDIQDDKTSEILKRVMSEPVSEELLNELFKGC